MKQFYLLSFILLCCFFSISVNTFSQTPEQLLSQTNLWGIEESHMLYPAEKPKISVQRGFYKKPFDVVVSTGIEGLTIYYTLDGSDPATSKYVFKAPSPVKSKSIHRT
jgi:hypothetical protein